MIKLIRHITFIAIMSWSCVAWAQPDEFGFIPNNASGTFYGQVTINGTPASGDDWVAAFDETGVCAGASQIVINNGIAYANLVIYGDDGTSTDIEEAQDDPRPRLRRRHAAGCLGGGHGHERVSKTR